MNSIAFNACSTVLRAVILCFLLTTAGCSVPGPAARLAAFDFGPGPLTAAPAEHDPRLPAVIIEVVQTNPALDRTDMLYRLAYLDPHQSRPYAQARWSMSPALLVRERLRGYLGQHRTVLSPGQAQPRSAAAADRPAPWTLQVELEEFSQLFSTPQSSVGLLRLRATLTQGSAASGAKVLQRHLIIQRPAPSADAAGGVRAMILATDAAAQELDNWLRESGTH